MNTHAAGHTPTTKSNPATGLNRRIPANGQRVPLSDASRCEKVRCQKAWVYFDHNISVAAIARIASGMAAPFGAQGGGVGGALL
jgi:hypothetical protein